MNRVDRLENILNQKSGGNPYHSKDGKFTFAPYEKYPMLEKSAKRLALLKKSENCLTEKYLEQVDIEREKLFKKYKQDKELEDDELSRWNDGWYMWGEKDKANFSDIDIALSKAIFKESKPDIDVYRTQVDSKNPGKMSKAEYASWSPDLEYVCKWARFIAGYDSKIDIFKNKPTLENIKIIPDVLYSQRFLRNKAKYQEYVLENKSSIEAFEHGLSRRDVNEKYINSIDLISRDSIPFDFYIKYNGGPGSGNFNPGQGRGVGKPAGGFSSPTIIYPGDDIKLKKDGIILEGTLQYKDGKFYLLMDKEKGGLIEISKDDIRKSIVSKSAKQKQKELLESQGIRHKSPKERRTPEQEHLISELDKMGLFKDKELGTWCMKYADEETLADIYTTLREAESLGLDISSIQLGRIKSGKTWGRAYYRTDGDFKLALSGQVYDRNPIQEKKIKECREGFHTDNSIKAVVRHETGHIISYQNAQRSFNTKDKPKNIWQQEDKVDSYCGKVVSEAMGYSYFTYRETLKDLKKYSNSEISEYGRTNFKEAIAESWSNPNYSWFTKKVSDILKKDLKKPRENSIMNERAEEIPICSGYGPEFEEFEYETSTGKVKTNSRIMRLYSLEKNMNSQKENLDYRYDVKAYKEYLKEWLEHKDEPEYLRNGVLSFSEFWEHDIDYDFEDYDKILKLIDEFNKKTELTTNGGPGSGNFNPGQGRGVGKPSDGHSASGETEYSSKNYLSKKDYEDIVNYVNEDNFTEEDFDTIAAYASSMGYGKSCELNQAVRENERTGEIEERKEIIYPLDDSQIVTWKDNREFLENKIKEKEAYDKLRAEYDKFRRDHWNQPEYRDEIVKRTEKINEADRKLNYDAYSNYVENYQNGLYKDIKDSDKMWTIDESKITKISPIELRKQQKTNPKEFYEKIEIPRLSWSTYNKTPTTTDTMASLYGKNFKDLDKLDNVIKNKGYTLDKDITVTRRVANIGVIKNRIENNGQYTQNGITSTTAAKSIVKKMPSGVNMGDSLIRITIPKGTKVISTWKPIEADIYKKANKYQDGKIYSEDEKNLRMLKNQNELILSSGSTFVSPGGNKLTQNEDGSYQLILKQEKVTRNQRLNMLKFILNQGNPYHDKFGKFSSADGASSSSSKLFYDAADYLGDESKSGDITKNIQSFKDFKDMVNTVKEDYNGGEIEGQEIWIHPESKLFKKLESPVTDENVVKQRKTEIENENKSPFILVSRYGGKDVIVDGNHVAASYRELSDEGKNYYVPILYVQKKEYERFEKDNPNYHEKEKVYTVTKKIDEK